MRKFILTLLLLLTPQVVLANPWAGMVFSHPSSLQLHLEDNVPLTFGNTRTAPDAWFDNNGTSMCLTSTSVDGGGTDGDVFCYTLGGNTITFGSSIILAAAGSVSWTDRSKLTSPANGDFILANNAGTQGIKFDTHTADGSLYLTDESGGNLTLVVTGLSLSGGISGTGTGSLYARTAGTAAAATSGELTLNTGANINAGNYATGGINIYTGNTTNDGNTGSITIYTGVAGAGATDAGDIKFGVHGNTTGGSIKVLGATGAVLINRVVGTGALAEPFACVAATAGAIVYVDDTNDSAAAVRCVCFATGDDGGGNPTMDWRDAGDPVGSVCTAF